MKDMLKIKVRRAICFRWKITKWGCKEYCSKLSPIPGHKNAFYEEAYGIVSSVYIAWRWWQIDFELKKDHQFSNVVERKDSIV